ncbi:hypothetical protein [Coprococcus hominis (ex Arizal et al. 2022)]|uniref:hypothetical protein n=1 Tax=Coprococcus hominis (ex Arizal et al. 2022) TaxID=2881262 RepID=UPI0032C12314
MKRKVRIFVYALVAWFVGLAVIAYDFAVSYAASFCDVKDSDWHAFQGGNTSDLSKNIGAISMPEIPTDRPVDSAELGKAKYTEFFSSIDLDSRNYVGYNYTLESDDEIVLVVTYSSDGSYAAYASGTMYALALSKSRIYHMSNQYNYNLAAANAWSLSSSSHNGKVDFTASTSQGDKVDMYCYRVQNGVTTSSNARKFAFKTGKMKVFDTIADAENYFLTGDTTNMAWNGAAREYDGENIYLDNFEMWVHDSNAYSAYYLEFKYTIPEQLRDAASLKLDIAESFEWCIGLVANTARIPKTFSGTNYIDILQNPTGFKLYLKDIDAVTDLVGNSTLSNLTRRAVLGSNMGPIDLSALTIDGLGGETLGKVTNSKLYLTCYVVANGKYGINYTGSVDFLSGANDMSSYTPDSTGNYKYNGDLKDQGHYETEVTIDDSGNQQYTYWYYGTDNSKTEITAKDSSDNTVSSGGSVGSIINNITMPDHVFVTVSGSAGGGSSGGDVGDVTIEDDDLSFNSLRDSIKDGYGLIDDTDTGTKGDGLVAMMSDLFGYLPASFTGLIMLGMSSVVGIAILRMIFKR